MNSIRLEALQYVRDNQEEGVNKLDFLDEHRPIGNGLWFALEGLILAREDGSLVLSSSGNAVLDGEPA